MHVQYTYWQDGDYYIGHLNDFPDYETEGRTLEELQKNLADLYHDMKSGGAPYIRQVAQLELA